MFFDNEGDQNNHQPASDTEVSTEPQTDQPVQKVENTKSGKLAMGIVAGVFVAIIAGALWMLVIQ